MAPPRKHLAVVLFVTVAIAPAAPERPAARAASSVTEHLSLSPLPLRAGGGLVFGGLF